MTCCLEAAYTCPICKWPPVSYVASNNVCQDSIRRVYTPAVFLHIAVQRVASVDFGGAAIVNDTDIYYPGRVCALLMPLGALAIVNIG